MADNIIEVVVRAKDEASKAFAAAAAGADRLASEQAAATKTGDALDQQAADTAAALERQAQAAEAAARAAAKLSQQNGGGPGVPVPAPAPTPAPGPMPAPSPIPPIPEPDPDGAKAEQIKNLSGRVMTLRYNLMDVGQQLAGGGSPFIVLMQQGPEIAAALGDASEAAEVLKASFAGILTKLAPLAGILAGLAVVAAAVTTAMILLKNATMDADEAGGRLAARLQETGDRASTAQEKIDAVRIAIVALRASNKDAETGLKELTGEIDRHAAQAERARIALDDQVETKRRDIALTIEQQKAHIEAADAQLKNTSVLNGLTEAEVEEARVSRQTAREKLAAAKLERAELEKLYNDRLGIISATEEYSRALDEEEEREQAANKARQEAKRHLSDLKMRYDDLVRALDAFQDRENLEAALSVPDDLIPAAAIQSARDLEAAINQIAPQRDVLDDYQRLTLLLSDAQRLAAENPGLQGWADNLSGQVSDALISGVQTGLEGAAKDLKALITLLGEEYAKVIQRGTRIGGAIGAIIGGDIAGGLSKAIPMLGAKFAEAFAGQGGLLGNIAGIAAPLSAALGAAIGGLQQLGQQGGAATARSAMSGIDAITKGINNLPAFLRKFIPDFIVTLITELVPALIAAFPQVMLTIVYELPIAIVHGLVMWWRDIGGFRGIARSIADGVREWWRDTWDRIRMWFKDIFTPGDQSRKRGRATDAETRAALEAHEAALDAIDPNGFRGGPVDAGTGRSRRGTHSAGPTLVLQAASLHPDIVPRALKDLDRLTRPGGLRRGTTALGGT